MRQGSRILVGQSGGPTAAINASLAGVFAAAEANGVEVVGMRYGIQGFLDGRTVSMADYLADPAQQTLLRMTPSSWLGSCRYKMPTPEEDIATYERIVALCNELNIGAVLYIGGNDSMDTIHKLSNYGDVVNSDIRFVGVPKTIDNDLKGTDHTPGFGSAAKYIATSVAEVACDSDVYDLKSVTFVEIMGRDAGWLAGSAALAGPACDIVLLPEAPVSEEALLERIAQILETKNTVVVGVSEGLRLPDGTLVCEAAATESAGVDSFGHVAQLSGTGRHLASVTKRELGVKTRAVELSTLQRAASHAASATDLDEAFAQGGAAVQAAIDGHTGVMCGLERVSSSPYVTRPVLADVHQVANQERRVPREWIAPDGMSVTEDFIRYARPLIAGEPTQFMVNGLPTHIQAL